MRGWLAAILAVWAAAAIGQEVLDRVMARVEQDPIMLSDVRAAIGFGLVGATGDDPTAAALDGLIERRLVLAEVARFSPPEPDAAAVEQELARLVANAGSAEQLAALTASTGLDQAQLRQLARDSLRIQAYLDQRFGASVVASEEEAAEYYRRHPDEFRRGGQILPFDQVEEIARDRAAAERRRAVIARWIQDLRSRGNVVVMYRR